MNRKVSFKILTCLLTLILLSMNSYAVSLQEENLKTHLRWKINSLKSQFIVEKDGEAVTLKTLDTKAFDELMTELSSLNLNKDYFKKFDVKKGSQVEPSQIVLEFKDDTIELFTFYQDKSNSHILDFWINQDLVTTRKAAMTKTSLPVVNKVESLKVKKSTILAKKEPLQLSDSKIDKSLGVKALPEKEIERTDTHRDFRYGASFVWDYEALIPELEKDIILSSKAPDFLYVVKDRDLSLGDEKEAHLQLSINFYKKKQWGLMTKSINLYEKKYGKDSHRYTNDFMRATSMLKNLIKPYIERDKTVPVVAEDEVPKKIISDKGVFAAAMNILENIAEGTQDYELRVAAIRYLLQVKLEKEDFFQALNLAKQLYVAGTEQLEDEIILKSTKAILYSLSRLNQVDKLQSFLENKAVKRLLPAQLGDAYITYILLKQEKTDQVISRFVANEKSYSRPIDPAILFNTAESYFREAKYEKAIDLFERLSRSYARLKSNSKALNRIALSSDLLDLKESDVSELYKKAINLGSSPRDQLEAKIRYVGYSVARNTKLNEEQLELVSFLDIREEEKKYLDVNMKKILWLTRLRTFIVQEQYSEALAYLSTIPLDTMTSIDKRVFDGDGAEIILGYIKNSYMNEDYAKAIKIWEVYKNEYESKVAKNPYLNFIVADSFIKLGLYDSFDRVLASFSAITENKTRSFPLWVEKHKELSVKDFIVELNIEKLIDKKSWDELAKYLENYKNSELINYNYYMGLVSYNKKNYNDCVGLFERIIVSPNSKNKLSAKQKFTMLTTYAESLYQGNDQLRFRKNASAILNDLKRSGFDQNQATIERISYLFLESLNATAAQSDYASIVRRSEEFKKEFSKSIYSDRIDYLLAISLIKTNQISQGKDVLEKLLINKDTAGYLKGLARTELSTLKLKENTL